MNRNFPQRGDRKKTTGLFSARGVITPIGGLGVSPEGAWGKFKGVREEGK